MLLLSIVVVRPSCVEVMSDPLPADGGRGGSSPRGHDYCCVTLQVAMFHIFFAMFVHVCARHADVLPNCTTAGLHRQKKKSTVYILLLPPFGRRTRSHCFPPALLGERGGAGGSSERCIDGRTNQHDDDGENTSSIVRACLAFFLSLCRQQQQQHNSSATQEPAIKPNSTCLKERN